MPSYAEILQALIGLASVVAIALFVEIAARLLGFANKIDTERELWDRKQAFGLRPDPSEPGGPARNTW